MYNFMYKCINSCQLTTDWWLCGWYQRRSARSLASRPPRPRSPSESRCISFVGKTTHLLPRFPLFCCTMEPLFCRVLNWGEGGKEGEEWMKIFWSSDPPFLCQRKDWGTMLEIMKLPKLYIHSPSSLMRRLCLPWNATALPQHTASNGNHSCKGASQVLQVTEHL